VLWVATIFFGSALLFAVQPMIARMLLPGQRWTLFEIDPLVKRIAEDERYFSYLPTSRTAISISRPLMRAMARDRGLAALIEEDFSPASTSPTMGSRWAFLARSADHLPAHGPAPAEPPPEPTIARVWTDDRSDAWSLFQW
jgi:hypothetical protein